MIRRDRFLHKKLQDDNLRIRKQFKQTLKKQLFEEKDLYMAKKPAQLNLKQLVSQKSFLYVGILALVMLTGTTAYALENRNQSIARQNIIEDTVELPENLEGLISVDQMRTLALNDAPEGSTISQIEVENEHGSVLYKVKFSDGSFRLYDAKTGLAFVDTHDEFETDETVPTDFVAGITLQQARNIAEAQRPGKTITKIELETEEGVVVYSVRFADDGRVDVNATDGSVLRVRDGDSEDSSDDSSEDKDEDDSEDDSSEDSSDDDGDDSDDDSGSGRSGNSGSGNNN